MNFCYNTVFTFPKNPKNLDLSYKTDLDFLDCLWEEKKMSCNLRNMVFKMGLYEVLRKTIHWIFIGSPQNFRTRDIINNIL